MSEVLPCQGSCSTGGRQETKEYREFSRSFRHCRYPEENREVSARGQGEAVPSGGTPGKAPLGDSGGLKPLGRTGVSRRSSDRVSTKYLEWE